MSSGTRRAHLAIVLFVAVTAVSAACVEPANPTAPFMPKGCYVGLASAPPVNDLYFDGKPNVRDNATEYSSTGGTCTGTVAAMVTIVRASSIPNAGATCKGLKYSGGVSLPNETWQKVPVDAYLCNP
jgi:hypothetical protein